jgi:hypothetical protein
MKQYVNVLMHIACVYVHAYRWTPVEFTVSEVHLLHREDYAAPFKLQRRLLLGGAHQSTTTATAGSATVATTAAAATADVSTSNTDQANGTATSTAATGAAAGDCDSSTTSTATVDSPVDGSSGGYIYPGMPTVPEPFMVPLFKDSSSSRGRRKRGKGRNSTANSDNTDRQRESSNNSSKLEHESVVDAKAEH